MTVAISRVVVTLCMATAPWTLGAPAGDHRTFRPGDHLGAVALQTALHKTDAAAGLPRAASREAIRLDALEAA